MIIRYSPSGPPIANAEGGTADVGPGFLLRLAEGTTSVTTGLDLTAATQYELKYDPSTATAPFLRPRLTAPSGVRRYRATGTVDILSTTTNATATITTRIFVSYDEAATWDLIGDCDHWIHNDHVKPCRMDVPLTLGSALAEPVPAAAGSIMIKMTVEPSIAGVVFAAPDGDGGTGFLQLSEHL